MKNTFLKILLFSLGFCQKMGAQDLVFSQSQAAPQLFNPSATGWMLTGSSRFFVQTRNQWDNPGSMTNYAGGAAGFDARFCQGNDFWAVGAVVQADRAAVALFSNRQAYFALAYHHQLGREVWGAAGVQAGALNYGFDADALRFDEQFDGSTFNGSLDDREDLENSSRTRFDLNAGLLLYAEDWSAGLALHHATTPVYGFLGDENRLGLGLTLHGSRFLKTSSSRAVLLHGLLRKQSFNWLKKTAPASQTDAANSLQWQILTGATWQQKFSNRGENRLGLGLSARVSGRHEGLVFDALVPAVQFGNEVWELGLSFDANLSRLPTRASGGFELSLRWSWGEENRCVNCPRMGVF